MTSPDPLPPAFFPVSLNLVGRRCIVIGDDAEARAKEAALREVGADVTRLQAPAALDERTLQGAFFVISTPKDEALSQRLRELAERDGFLLCTIDQPAFGFVAMAAIVKCGPARIAISTGGVAPRIGKKIREALQGALDATFARFLAQLAKQRLHNRSALETAQARRAAMIESADGFEVEVRVRYPKWFMESERDNAIL